MGFNTTGSGSRGVQPNMLAWGIVAIVVIIFLAVAVANNELRARGYTRIDVPDMKGSYSTYYCKDFREENGCVLFKDNIGWERKICGSYQIIK